MSMILLQLEYHVLPGTSCRHWPAESHPLSSNCAGAVDRCFGEIKCLLIILRYLYPRSEPEKILLFLMSNTAYLANCFKALTRHHHMCMRESAAGPVRGWVVHPWTHLNGRISCASTPTRPATDQQQPPPPPPPPPPISPQTTQDNLLNLLKSCPHPSETIVLHIVIIATHTPATIYLFASFLQFAWRRVGRRRGRTVSRTRCRPYTTSSTTKKQAFLLMGFVQKLDSGSGVSNHAPCMPSFLSFSDGDFWEANKW